MTGGLQGRATITGQQAGVGQRPEAMLQAQAEAGQRAGARGGGGLPGQSFVAGTVRTAQATP